MLSHKFKKYKNCTLKFEAFIRTKIGREKRNSKHIYRPDKLQEFLWDKSSFLFNNKEKMMIVTLLSFLMKMN